MSRAHTPTPTLTGKKRRGRESKQESDRKSEAVINKQKHLRTAGVAQFEKEKRTKNIQRHRKVKKEGDSLPHSPIPVVALYGNIGK